MKVALPKDYRKLYTLEELDIARSIIRDMKEDESTPAEYITYAINHWMSNTGNGGYIKDVYKATAEIAKNHRAWNAYSEESQGMDIWIQAVAETEEGFLRIEAYLTDIWSLSADVDYTPRFYTEFYTR